MGNPKRARAQAAAAASSAAKYRRQAYRADRDRTPPSATLGTRETCWCGEAHGHDWPGRADGAPHPRDGAPGARQ
ncbi:hypothetical protein AB0P17_36525 [Streptomyces sp. NPDC088124]|uniref:hypothetical protein n=1 Tax=Streptomyces sp. NPDC088124 TaxID=3154654 RepID=UPI0034397907